VTTRRNGWYWVKRNFRGIGRVERSLYTRRKAVAQARERALISLHEQGRLDVIRAWLDSDFSIEALTQAFEAGRVEMLMLAVRSKAKGLQWATETYLESRRGDVKATTLERYAESLAHLRSFVGKATTHILTTDVLAEYRAARSKEGASRGTVNVELDAIQTFAGYCVRKGWLSDRPTVNRYPTEARIKYLDRGQIAAYMAALRPAFRPLMLTLIGTGMRLGEAERLTDKDVRYEKNGTARVTISDAKTPTGVRVVYIPKWLVDEGALETLPFSIPRRTVQKEHQRARTIAGLGDYTIHDHRHTAAVHLALAGIPLGVLQQQLGHARIEMTMRYARFHPEYAKVDDGIDA
jgi:integrase